MVMIVNLAISNPEVINASLTAHHILYVCKSCSYPEQLQTGVSHRGDADGVFIQKESHRHAILEFLRTLGKRSGWPSGHLISRLQGQWSDQCFTS